MSSMGMGDDDDIFNNPCSLQLIYKHGQGTDNVLGFGWATSFGFGMANFNPLSMSSPNDVIAKQKNFTMVPYVRREGQNSTDTE